MELINTNRPGMTERAGIFIMIGLMGAGLIVGSALSFLLWKVMTGQDTSQMQTSMMDPAFVNEVRVVQTMLAVFIFFIPALVTAFILNKKPISFLGFHKKNSIKTIVLGLLVMVATVALSGALATLNEMIPLSESMQIYFKGLEDAYMKQVAVLSQMSGISDLLISIIVMAFAPAIFEEVFFRGAFQQMLTKATGKVMVSVIITSVLFSAIHFSFYGFLSRTALGIILGLLFAKSGNIWIPILAHFVNNAIAVLQVYYLRMNGKSIEDSADDKFPLWVGLLAIAAIYFIFDLYIKSIKQDAEKQSISSVNKELVS